MVLLDWSKGYVYVRSYIDIVLKYPEHVLLSSRRGPVRGIPGASPGIESVQCRDGALARKRD